MSVVWVPEGYRARLDILQTAVAIKFIKDTFERELAAALGLTRVSAPLYVRPETGLNDDLSGVERPVAFDIPDVGAEVQIVQSLAKWKRFALKRYGVPCGSGLYADMNAVRRDEELDNLHSSYVDQWDWEKIIAPEQRNTETLHETVRLIYGALLSTWKKLRREFPQIDTELAQEITFVTTQQLEDRYPELSPKQREDAAAKEYGAVFLEGIGGALKSGNPHDLRAPDYDDWTMNGDILLWYPVLDRAVELTSMGIRVDAEALLRQLELSGCMSRLEMPFHRALMAGELPQTMGGGLGQSRICMLLLGKAHVGEVQASVWPERDIEICEKAGIQLL